MTKSQERKLNNAIRILEIKYQVALSKPDIKYPLAWALYQTWKEEDIKSRKTEGEKSAIKEKAKLSHAESCYLEQGITQVF